ncbi:cytidine deaminase [Serratia marcescens]|uniref:deaminase n=1 Tax=Serratia marcescens TaxID=615 RepID=UPI0011537236|nr:deaminase [Serratia marcescens]QDI18351.1 cytidine deaminase [Serratia marcescens]QDI28094.1 cytidine deaminase [Serratia marcescens]QDI42558.1 cytidine deaminase [Serratia marcescens]QDI56987.1 cytidine deaminase [Serratia marcescens]
MTAINETMNDSELANQAMEALSKCINYPKIGAVVSKNGVLLSTGFRGEVSGKHAERVAIEKLSVDQLQGATIYTTLEPCTEIHEGQREKSCCELIAESGISEVYIGVLDPNGKIYCKGMNFLRDNGLTVKLFSSTNRQKIENSTFKYDDFSAAIGSGKRRVRSVKNGKKFTVQFSKEDERKVSFQLSPLSMPLDHIDLVAANDSVRLAPDITDFSNIPDPMLYQDPSHFARLSEGEIAIIAEPQSTMVLLVKVLEITPTDIFIQWEARNIRRS